MSAWLAILRAELRRALPVLPWIALLHLLVFFIRSGVGPVLSDRLATWIELATWALATVVLVPSAWSDSPSRDARFIATRPVNPLAFHSAKLTGLLVLVALPFAAVEFATLVAAGMSGRVVVLGTLQIAAFLLVVVIASFPILWLWRGKIAAIIGIALMPAAVSGFFSYFVGRQHRHDDRVWARIDVLLSAPVLMLALAAIAILLGCLLLYRGPFRRTAMLLLYLPLTCLGACFAVWCATRPFTLGNPVPSALVSVDLNTSPGDIKPADRLMVRPATPAIDRQFSVTRGFSKLVVNGRDLSPWALAALGSYSAGDFRDVSLRQALRAHYGDRIKLPPYEYPSNPPADFMSSFVRDGSGGISLDLAIRETALRWELLGELPLVEGASLRHGDIRWDLNGRLEPGGEGGMRRVLTLSHHYPSLWLGSLKKPVPPPFRFLGILPDGEVVEIENYWPTRSVGSRSTLREDTLTVRRPITMEGIIIRSDVEGDEYEPPELPASSASDWPEGSRLVILQPAPVSQTDYIWKSPAPLPAPVRAFGRQKPAAQVGTVMEWIKTHPAPAQPSNADEVSAWLAEFMPRISAMSTESPDFKKLVDIVSDLVPPHPDRVHGASLINDGFYNPAYDIVDRALRNSLPQDAIQRFPKLGEDPRILQIYQQKGWTTEIVPHVARRIRLGASLGMADVLLKDPQAAGFSETEWLALFRLSGSPELFRGLRATFIPAPLLDEEADRIIDRSFAINEQSYYTDVNPLMDLALARGREDGPRWLREWVLGWRKHLGPRIDPEVAVTVYGRNIVNLLRRNFEIPQEITNGEKAYEWFFAQDPAAFRFNPETRKYQLP